MTIQQKIISNKLGLLNLAEELGNVSKACKLLGFSRDTFYRYKEAVDSGGVEALTEKSRRKPNTKNRIDEAIEAQVIQMAIDHPAFGQKRASNELRKLGVFLSPAGVRCAWLRHGMETFQKRLAMLEQKMAETNGIYTESQMAALEKKQLEKELCGEIETEHPGYLGSQDTFFVGTLKGVGRIYQQTFVDTYSRVACAKLYNQKTPITAADLLNDKVIPLFENQGLELLRILTDRGTEYCGKVEQHDYQLFLAIHDIDHTRTKARHPQTNGICERFHKTALQEFYQLAFRKKVYKTIEELQLDLDGWLKEYNERRPHEGKRCNGKTPMETFIDGIKICREKTINQNLH
ncbi:MAG: IS481 family transposase [Bdellovibrio sp.]